MRRPKWTTSESATRLDSVDAVHRHRVGDRHVRRGRSANTVACALRDEERRDWSPLGHGGREVLTEIIGAQAGVDGVDDLGVVDRLQIWR